MPVPLHVKSHASPGIGVHAPEALAGRAAALGFRALALTDVENLYAQVRFHHACRAFGLRALTGVELRTGFAAHAPGALAGRLVLLARDRAGYESLCRIVSRRRLAPLPTPDPLSSLGEEAGLFYLSDDVSVLARLIERGVDPSSLRHLVVRPDGPAGASSVRPVADADAILIAPEDHMVHRLAAAVRAGCRVDDVHGLESAERVLRGPGELAALFDRALLEESDRIAEACTLDLTEVLPAPPRLSGAADPSAELAERCVALLAAKRAAGRMTGVDYDVRLVHELAVIGTLSFADLFLVVGEIVAEARARRIAVAARGSASGSLVACLLGAGGVDPIAHGLLFERFLHARRKRPPDIDLDLSSDRREEILDWVFDRFGEERVAMVSAHQTFGRRAALREGLKAFGLAPGAIARFSAALPADDLFDDALPRALLPATAHEALPVIERLVGAFRTLAVHPGGIVIADPRIDRHAPLERAPKGVVVTQYDMHALEAIGLVKIDLLGNRALSALDRVCAALPAAACVAPDGDPATLALLSAGRTVGCFQLETPVVRPTLEKLPVRGIEDVVAAIAIVRPGPASGEAKAAFIRRANREEEAAPPHPRLAELVAPTYGLLLYEEQLTQAIALLTGWPLERADELREAIADERASSPAFLAACAQTGIAPEDAARLWRLLARFASYSFNKAHAVSYAGIAWTTAYHKAHHPAAFACAVLAHYGGAYPLRTIAAEFARLVPVRAPHVAHSFDGPSLEDGGVRLGLAAIRHGTARTRERILRARPFEDAADFLRRVPMARAELEAFVLSGALDGLAPLSAPDYPLPHFALLGRPAPSARGELADTWRALVRANHELRFLGMHPSAHPMAILRAEALAAGCVTSAELSSHAGERARLAGLVAASRRWRGAAGTIVQFVTFEDEFGVFEALVPARTYRALGDPVRAPGPWLIDGRVVSDHGSITLRVEAIEPFHRRRRPYAD
jgi:DNA polymerase III alpha subunit